VTWDNPPHLPLSYRLYKMAKGDQGGEAGFWEGLLQPPLLLTGVPTEPQTSPQ
jgi:hypothetical protein